MSDEKTTPTTALALPSASRYEPADLGQLVKLAQIVSASSLAPKHVKSWQDAMMIMKRGAELGLPTQMALENIFVINGKTSMYADAAVALVKAHGHRFDVVESTAERATVKTVRNGYEADGESYSSGKPFTYMIEDAKKAGWTSNKMYSTIPRNMLLARAKMELARMVYEDLLAGVYDPTEMMGTQRVDVEVLRQVADHYGAPADDSGEVAVVAEFEPDQEPEKPERAKPSADWTKANAKLRAILAPLEKAVADECIEAYKRMLGVESLTLVSPNDIRAFAERLEKASTGLEAAARAMIQKYPASEPADTSEASTALVAVEVEAEPC